jgi:hypothetical protein
MSATEIMRELPKLSAEDRAALRQRLRELDEQDDVQFLHDSALAQFQELDKQEAENARRKAR